MDALAAGKADSFDDLHGFVNYQSRDHTRTPMQWSDDEHAGFTEGEPWFPVNENYRDINVESARTDERSVWHHYRKLINLRHDAEVLVCGEYDLLLPDHEHVYAYTRTLDDERMLIVLNWSDAPVNVDFSHTDIGFEDTDLCTRISNYDEKASNLEGRPLRPYEAVVYQY